MAPKRPEGAGALENKAQSPNLGHTLSPVPVRSGSKPLYAALDLGTNSCRRLIAQPKGTGFHVVDSFSKSVNWARGLRKPGDCRADQ